MADNPNKTLSSCTVKFIPDKLIFGELTSTLKYLASKIYLLIAPALSLF